jgi:AraC-like DNA-binding protein
MTLQTSSQAFQSPVVAIGASVETRSLQDLLAQVQSIPPADLAEARAVIARLAELASAQVTLPPRHPQRPGVFEPDAGGLTGWRARKIMAYIEARLDRVIYNGELARAANLSVSYFCRAFRKSFGESAHCYVMRRRVVLAQGLIALGGQGLADVALACGFSDQAHMTRVFTRFVGTSPSRWRRTQGCQLQ